MNNQSVALAMTEGNFDQLVLKNTQLVVVCFSADWSGSSDIMHPIFDDLAERFAGQVTFGKIDFERQSHIAARFGVTSVPTILLFTMGRVIDVIEGVISKGELAEKVKAQR